VLLTVSVLAVAAVNVSLLALAVVAVAVGPLDDASRAAGGLVVTGLSALEANGDEHDGQRRKQGQGTLHDGEKGLSGLSPLWSPSEGFIGWPL